MASYCTTCEKPLYNDGTFAIRLGHEAALLQLGKLGSKIVLWLKLELLKALQRRKICKCRCMGEIKQSAYARFLNLKRAIDVTTVLLISHSHPVLIQLNETSEWSGNKLLKIQSIMAQCINIMNLGVSVVMQLFCMYQYQPATAVFLS